MMMLKHLFNVVFKGSEIYASAIDCTGIYSSLTRYFHKIKIQVALWLLSIYIRNSQPTSTNFSSWKVIRLWRCQAEYSDKNHNQAEEHSICRRDQAVYITLYWKLDQIALKLGEDCPNKSFYSPFWLVRRRTSTFLFNMLV